jgi:alpha-mannosidase
VPYPGQRVVSDEERDPGHPHDAYTDQGEHSFRYALYPHTGDAMAGGVVHAAYAFNHPLRVLAATAKAGSEPGARSFLRVEAENVIVETVKAAEDAGCLVVRLYEASGAPTRTTVSFGFPVRSVDTADLLERPTSTLALSRGSLPLEFHPFEMGPFEYA